MFFRIILVLIVAHTSVALLSSKAYQSASTTPEAKDFPETQDASLMSRTSSSAIGCTGGGARAYIACLGYIAALTELGLMKRVRYLGGISGGAWATTVYTMAQTTDDSILLGPITPPEEINLQDLQLIPEGSARRAANGNLTLQTLEQFDSSSNLGEMWAKAVGKVYLEPVGIPSNTRFSWNQATVDEIKKQNRPLKDATFVVPARAETPFSIIGTTLVGPQSGAPYKADAQNYTMLEFTPLYVGQMKTNQVTYSYSPLGIKHTKTIGGLIEPYAFPQQGRAPMFGLSSGETSGTISMIPEPDSILDLAFAAGASSYAPGALLESLPLDLSNKLGLHFDYWAPADHVPFHEDTLFADGGSYENINLISFLQRKVEHIILFFNSEQPLAPSSSWNPAVDEPNSNQVSDSLSCFFGVLPSEQAGWEDRSYQYEKDQVFAKADYAPLMQELQAKQEVGKGVIVTKRLTTVANEWWGIPEGFETEITFVYLSRLPVWEAKLNPEMHGLLVPEDPALNNAVKGDFRNFPHYATTGGLLSYQKINALADLVGWSVLANADVFKQVIA